MKQKKTSHQGTSVSYGTRVEVDDQCNGGAEMTADESLGKLQLIAN